MRTATKVAIKASSILNSSRIAISWLMGCPVHMDVPKSKRGIPTIQVMNCFQIGWSRPSCARSRASASFGA